MRFLEHHLNYFVAVVAVESQGVKLPPQDRVLKALFRWRHLPRRDHVELDLVQLSLFEVGGAVDALAHADVVGRAIQD